MGDSYWSILKPSLRNDHTKINDRQPFPSQHILNYVAERLLCIFIPRMYNYIIWIEHSKIFQKNDLVLSVLFIDVRAGCIGGGRNGRLQSV